MNKTRIIVFEGIDGSGKSLQFTLLKDRLIGLGFSVAMRDFPDYATFFGTEVGRLLSGSGGIKADTVDGKSMALWFALDRWENFHRYIDGEANFLIINRYVLSNAVYQSIRDIDIVKPDIVDWVLELEYGHFKLPRPDVNLFFDVGVSRAQSNVGRKGFREYMGSRGEHDVYEASGSIQSRARDKYLECARRYDDVAVIDCMEGETMCSPESIAEKAFRVLCDRRLV